MPDLLVQAPDMGLNALKASSLLEKREAAKGTQNIFYENGLLKTPFGFAKLDLTTGLNSGDKVLHIFPFKEIDGYSHHIAVTTEKIYDHDRVNEEWDDITQSSVTMLSSIQNPVSYVAIAHDDTDIYLDDDTGKSNTYYHLIICDGGQSNIQRYAGRYEADCGDLVGGGGYHDGTTHRALQVGVFQSRLILLNPKAYNSTTKLWVDNNQRVRWPTVAKIQTWTGTGSSFSDLIDTGGTNKWSGQLGSQYVIYQTKGIWNLNYVGGTKVFDPKVAIPDLGLLASHLLVMKNNVHYFVGTDYNVYAYYGGSIKQKIGDKIHKYLQEDLSPEYAYRCWMAIGPEDKRLWIFIVPAGSTYITKAYGLDRTTGSWTVRDFGHKWSSTTGITAVNLLGAETYTVGDTYQDALDTLSSHDVSDAGDATVRYGDKLLDTSRTLAADYTAGVWTAGGFGYTLAGQNFPNDFTKNDVLVVFDGSNATNVRWGTHFYWVMVSKLFPTTFTVYGSQDVSTQGDHGIADNSTNVPADLSVDGLGTIGFYSVCSGDGPGQTYRQLLQEVQDKERLVVGDNAGFVYEFDSTYTKDDADYIDSRHLTPVEDWNQPHKNKLWPGLSVIADGTVDGAMYLRYRTSDFDTSETGWTDITFDLTSSFTQKEVWINKTSKAIQAEFKDFCGKTFSVREYNFHQPLVEENR